MPGVTIETLNSAAALLHAAQAIAVIVLTTSSSSSTTTTTTTTNSFFDAGRFALERTTRVFTANGTVAALTVPAGTLEVRGLMIGFFILSALFQSLASAFMGGRAGALRYIEYSLTAALMIMAISVEAGIRDVYTLECQFVLLWVTQLLGIASDYVHHPRAPWAWVFPHMAGWFTLVAAYAPIIDSFNLSRLHSAKQPPAFVSVLVIAEFVLFSCFGLVQAYGLAAKTRVYTTAYYQSEHDQFSRSLLRATTNTTTGGGGGGGGALTLTPTTSNYSSPQVDSEEEAAAAAAVILITILLISLIRILIETIIIIIIIIIIITVEQAASMAMAAVVATPTTTAATRSTQTSPAIQCSWQSTTSASTPSFCSPS